MSTPAQITANRRNARFSTGPKTEEGKEAIARNNLRHGLTGAFFFLQWEKPENFDHLLSGLRAEHNPQTPTELILVERMAQHEWLRQRAQFLQQACFTRAGSIDLDLEKQFSLYLRYQTTHERGFHKCLNELLKLRAERRKSGIGFESQKQESQSQPTAAESQSTEAHSQPETSAPPIRPSKPAAKLFFGHTAPRGRAVEPSFESVSATDPTL